MGLGTQGLGDSGTWDAGTRGRGTQGCRDVGRGETGPGDAGLALKTSELVDVERRRLEDVINKQHLIQFSLNLLSTIFGAPARKVLYAGEFVSRLVADDFQRPWFSLICLLAYFTVKARIST